MKARLYGLIAEFETHQKLLHAAELAHHDGYRNMDAYSPFPVAGLERALGQRRAPIPLIVLISGIVGGVSGYFMEWYAMGIDYPLDIGGRPLNSWPAFIPITFELTVLCAALAAIISMLALNRLPQPYHPVFNAPGFSRASIDRFFLCIESSDPMFESGVTRKFMESLGPCSIAEVNE